MMATTPITKSQKEWRLFAYLGSLILCPASKTEIRKGIVDLMKGCVHKEEEDPVTTALCSVPNRSPEPLSPSWITWQGRICGIQHAVEHSLSHLQPRGITKRFETFHWLEEGFWLGQQADDRTTSISAADLCPQVKGQLRRSQVAEIAINPMSQTWRAQIV